MPLYGIGFKKKTEIEFLKNFALKIGFIIFKCFHERERERDSFIQKKIIKKPIEDLFTSC